MNPKTLVSLTSMGATVFALAHCSSNEADSPSDSTTAAGGTSATVTATVTSSTTGATTTNATSATVTSTTTASSSSSSTTTATVSSTSQASSAATTTGTGGATASSSSEGTETASSTGTGTGTETATSAGGASTGAGGTTGTTGGGEFTLTSSELEEGGEFLPKHTCAEAGFDNDESPPLAWSGAPAAAQSFALVFLDTTLTDQGDNNGYHWAMWDIPADVSELPANLPEGAEITDPVSAKQYNPLSPSYLGPCPNIGASGNTDTYVFTLYAMPEAETASLAGLNNVRAIVEAIQAVEIGSASLSGTSDAVPP